MNGRVIVAGSYVQDHAWQVDRFPQPGETRRATGFNACPGGKGFNQAVACRRQGVATSFVGAIGDDALGATARQFAQSEQLDAHWQTCRQAPTASCSILINARGENLIAVHLAANEWLDPAFVLDRDFSGARVVLCQLENNLDAIAAALASGRAAGALCVLNPAPVHPGMDRALLDTVDILTPNETEFALLCAQFTGMAPAAPAVANLPQVQLHQLCRQLCAGTVLITLGAQGCFVSHGNDRRGDLEPYYRLAPEAVTAVDTTGAGDAFSGGLAAALCLFEQQPFKTSVIHANRVAALSTETLGTAPAMPTRTQVQARFGD